MWIKNTEWEQVLWRYIIMTEAGQNIGSVFGIFNET